METFLIKALQLILALGLLVIIHEFGHYIFARMFGIKVEKFYLFFDPWFSLIKWKPKKKGDQLPMPPLRNVRHGATPSMALAGCRLAAMSRLLA